jgi:uncharacterized membrane protein YsdA (DUF1294 family)
LDRVLLAVVVSANLVSLICFGVDKLLAMRRGGRIPEGWLLSLAFLGPFGAVAGMLVFRHKTRKPRFLLVPLFALLQLALAMYIQLI